MTNFEALTPNSFALLTEVEATLRIEAVCSKYEHFIDREAAMAEWILFQRVIQLPLYKKMDLGGCLEHILHPNLDTYLNLGRLGAIGVSLPVTSVNCERGISGYDTIKTDGRNMLSVQHMDNLLRLFLEAPGLEQFDFIRAFNLWLNERERRSFASIIKGAKVSE